MEVSPLLLLWSLIFTHSYPVTSVGFFSFFPIVHLATVYSYRMPREGGDLVLVEYTAPRVGMCVCVCVNPERFLDAHRAGAAPFLFPPTVESSSFFCLLRRCLL